jgi:hypothetical protein
MIRALRKLGIEGLYLNIIRAIYDKPITNIILTIIPKVKNMTKVPTLPIPTQHSPGIPSQSNKAKRRNKRNTNR